MNDNICMSWKNIKNKEERCQREKHKNSDFCRYHIRSSKYMPNLKNNKIVIDDDYLDNNHLENLLGLHDSWQSVPQENRIELNNKWWDINMLVDLFSNQLTSSELENPKPMYPHDPFTRKNFKPCELEIFKKKCKQLDIDIYIGLIEFLNLNLKKIYKEEYGTSNKISLLIVNELSKNLRYRLVNDFNSQNCHNGVWVKKESEYSFFENLYKLYKSLPQKIIFLDGTRYLMMDNPEKIEIGINLKFLPNEVVDLHSNEYVAKII